MLKLRKNARKHCVTIKNVAVICLPIILLLWKFWIKLMISYPNSETGLLLTTSLAGTVCDTLKKSVYA